MTASSEIFILSLTAATVGVVHTLLGPDHSVPFVAMSRAGGWSASKTLWVTAGCGLGHVAGSVLIGCVGLVTGIAVMRLEAIESLRGDTAAWMLIAFGCGIVAWGIVRAIHDQPHVHGHCPSGAPVWTPWLLFVVFVFGPCEPLIPLLMVPVARANPTAVAAVVASFTLATVVTMVLTVSVLRFGVSLVHLPRFSRFGHAIAGLAILACGVLVKLGL